MPPPKIQQPEFSPYGRYIIDTVRVKAARASGEQIYFHDCEGLTEQCGIVEEKMQLNQARFNNSQWAKQRGYFACQFCVSGRVNYTSGG